jgi:Trypsin
MVLPYHPTFAGSPRSRRHRLMPLVALGVALPLAGCAGEDGADTGRGTDEIVNPKPIDQAPDIVERSTVRVSTPGGGLCSGTLVGFNRVVTAKHCVVSSNPLAHTVHFSDFSSQTAGAIKTHPTADIAVLVLNGGVPFSSGQAPALVHGPRQGSIAAGDRVVVAGFGITGAGRQDTSVFVRFGKVKFDRFLGNYRFADGSSFSSGLQFSPESCSGSDPACSVTCSGDSGGPVFQFRPGEGFGLIGVTSGGTCDGLLGTGFGARMIAADARSFVDFILFDS